MSAATATGDVMLYLALVHSAAILGVTHVDET